MSTLYLKCGPGDVAPLVLLSGDPARVDRVAEMLDSPRKISQNREFSVTTGGYHGAPITVASGGIGAPSTAIAIHELVQAGARVVVRIGTMMGIEAPLGTVALSTGAARCEGASVQYLPLYYPAVPDWALVNALHDSARRHDLDVRLGITATCDAFYVDMAPSLVGQSPLDVSQLQRAHVLALDMETSLVFVLGAVLGIAAAAMCLVTVQAEPHTHMDLTLRAERDDSMVRAALDGLVTFGASLPEAAAAT